MTDWDAKAKAAIDHIRDRKRKFPEGQMLDLVDFLAAKGTATEAEMQAHGSADFVLTVLGHVTTAVHGGGSVPKDVGWYRHPSGEPYAINPDFAKAWAKVRSN